MSVSLVFTSRRLKMNKVLFGAAITLTLTGVAWSQTTADHDKIVSCYVGTWAFYR